MCGIAGIFAYGESAPLVDREELLRMREAMMTRGPDGAGLWVSDDNRSGLAHRRLAIIDLSEAGAQPMATSDGRLQIILNGEIYNYRELRRELEAKGYVFRSNSDTEVLLHLYADRDVDMVHALRGMFAFAIWDQFRQRLFLARDPFGIKPLYYADDGATFRFASQVKALLKGGGVDTAPEPAGSVGFLIWGAVPEPYTLYRGIHALPAGTSLIVRRGSAATLNTFFSMREELERAQCTSQFDQARDEVLAEALHDSVRHHMLADVPIGVFLSSGLDSGLVMALAADESPLPLRAVTLGFHEYVGTNSDEVPLAHECAKLYGASHQASLVSRDDFEAELPRILSHMDQPSIDGINTYFVSRAASQSGLKVALSGLGGDELFGGYPSFQQVPRLCRWLRFARSVPSVGRLSRRLVSPILARTAASPKFAGILEYGGSYGGAYLLRRALFMPWELNQILDPATVQVGLERLAPVAEAERAIDGVDSARSKITILESTFYLRNQSLRDADWAGMAHSLEIRVPLVDVSLFRALAPYLMGKRPPGKQEAIAILHQGLPEAVKRRSKTGFGTPVRDWIVARDPGQERHRGLRGWARKVLPIQPKSIRHLALPTDDFGGT